MLRALLILLFFYSLSFSQQNFFQWNTFSYLKNKANNVNNFSIKTEYDYRRYINDFLKLAQIDSSYYFYLGLLYYNNIKLANGKVIKANIEKAYKMFELSEKANPLSDYYIGLILVSKGFPLLALKKLEESLNRKNLNKRIYELLAQEFSIIVLNNLPLTSSFLKKTIRYMKSVEYTPLSGYILAHLFYFSGNIKKANYIINYVCTTTKNKEILKLCKTSFFLKHR